jgi:ribonuclease Z
MKCITKKGFDTKTEFWKNYHKSNHTSTIELAEIADKAKPKLVVLYHILFWGATEEDIIGEISTKYMGKVIVGKDLDIY